MSFNEVRQDFSTILNNLGYPVAWENTQFDSTDAVFLAEYFIPAETGARSIGKGGQQVNVGVYQIDVNTPLNVGVADRETALAAIENAFYNGLITTSGAVITRTGRSGAIIKDGKNVVVYSVFFEQYEQNKL